MLIGESGPLCIQGFITASKGPEKTDKCLMITQLYDRIVDKDTAKCPRAAIGATKKSFVTLFCTLVWSVCADSNK